MHAFKHGYFNAPFGYNMKYKSNPRDACDIRGLTKAQTLGGASMTKSIPLTQWKTALVDNGDFEYLDQWDWTAFLNNGKWYAKRSLKYKPVQVVLMHRVIMNAPKGVLVDHISGDGLDNRRKNLRLSTTAQNQYNRGAPRQNTSGFKGVSLHKKSKKYYAQIQVDGKLKFLGSFSDPVEAAHTYDKAAKFYFGAFARLNFPADWHDTPAVNL